MVGSWGGINRSVTYWEHQERKIKCEKEEVTSLLTLWKRSTPTDSLEEVNRP
jgi:hypothetical protein